jgi:putative ABC transport system permease protein
MLSSLSHAWRSWTSARAVAALAIVAFAVGIGSATAIYTVVNGVMLRPLPYADGHRFVALYGARFTEPHGRSAHNIPDLIEYQQRSRSFDAFGWFRPGSFNMTFAGQPQHVVGAVVTPSLVRSLGVNLVVGQWFEDNQGAVISSSLWRRLGSDPGIIGKAVTLDGRTFTITGVTPPGFRLPVPGPGVEGVHSEIWIRFDPLAPGENPSGGYYFSYARLKPGVTLAQADADVKRVAAEIAALDPASHPSYTARLDDLRESVLLRIKPTLLLLVVATGVLLLITCADVAGLLLARSVVRARETAIRVALGAPQRQLALHYFLEGLIVALAGAAAGVLLSAALVRIVIAVAAEYIPRAEEVALDWTVLLFALAVALLGTAVASLAPLWQALRTTPADVLSDGVRATASARTRRLSQSLVVAEIALAFALLTTGAVLVTHLFTLSRVSPGFNSEHLLTFQVTPPDTGAKSGQRVQQQRRLVEALEAIPGVTGAALANSVPLTGCCFSTTIYPEGRPEKLETVERISFRVVSSNYFSTLQIPLRSGRFLDARDTREDLLAIVVNDAVVRSQWPGQNPLGAYGRVGGPRGTRFQVVGVVGDIRNDGLGKPTVPEIYLSSEIVTINPLGFFVRSTLPPETLIPEVRRTIQNVDSALPIHHVAMMRDIVHDSMSLERVGSLMMIFFALAALLMASLGVYGVVSYSVRQTTVEIGTRMALGAVGRDLLFMVVGNGLRMAAYGAVIGGIAVILAAWALVRVFEIRDVGALPFVASTAVVAIVATTASFFPAWRATRLSPMVAIRNDPATMWQSTRQTLWQTLSRVSRAVAFSDDGPREPDRDLLTELVAAARGAASFAEAFQRALATLRDRIGATSVVLLEHVSGEYRPLVAIPDRHQPRASLPDNGFLLNRLRFYSYPLPFSTGDLESWLRWARDYYPEYAAEIQALLESGDRMAVALRARSEILGVLLLGSPSSGGEYSAAEKHLLRQCAEQLTMMIENARLTSRIVEQEKLRRDVALAAEVQRRLLPDHPPTHAAAVLAAVSVPARTVGGDYYDFLDLGEQRIGIALADIAGKGVAAALIMAVVQASLRIVAAEGGTSLPELAAKMNGYLHRSTGSNSYATFFYAQLDERSRQLRYVNAGHNPPYLLRPAREAGQPSGSGDGGPEIRELSIGGTVLGLFPQMSYEEATVDLRSGDVLVAFTDGVTEALNASEEEFGEERLKDLLRGVIHLPAPEISSRISEGLRGWIKDTTQYDDLTFVVMKVN